MLIPNLTLVRKPLETYLIVRESDGDRELTAAECETLYRLAQHGGIGNGLERAALEAERMAKAKETSGRGGLGIIFAQQSATDLREFAKRLRSMPVEAWSSDMAAAPKGKALLLFAAQAGRYVGKYSEKWKGWCVCGAPVSDPPITPKHRFWPVAWMELPDVPEEYREVHEILGRETPTAKVTA